MNKENCPHFKEVELISSESLKNFTFPNEVKELDLDELEEAIRALTLGKDGKNEEEVKKPEEIPKDMDPFLCLSCSKIFDRKSELISHLSSNQELKSPSSCHKIFINLKTLKPFCSECNNLTDSKTELINLPRDMGMVLSEEDFSKIKIHLQFLKEKKFKRENFDIFSKEEIYQMKYNKFITNLKENKFSKILVMVGAGISTTAGIPDFRSSSGLFKQLQDKYHLSSPEEFFSITRFLRTPEYFYEFSKLFDLSQTKPTLTHKFINFLICKNLCKYLFTQNIDGLEDKAKIPFEKTIYAHGNFLKGHCPKCRKAIDINLINEGIKNGKVVFCDVCKGPCKPDIVFYGEPLNEEFYKKIGDIKDCDLCIIMGTSLKVYPFASVYEYTMKDSWKVVINFDEVGDLNYDLLTKNSLFIQGKTDDIISKLVKEIGWEEEFKDFLKNTYGDLDMVINEVPLISVNEKEK